MRSLFIFISVFIFCAAAYAQQGVLSGRVVQNGKPVAGASVNVTVHDPAGNKTFTAAADSAGDYRFEGLPAGSYMVIAEGERGKGIAYRDGVIVGGTPAVLDLELTMEDYKIFESSFRIREIVTISAGASQPIDEVAKSVNAITGQEMRERADIALADSLRSMPGFRVQQLGGFGRTATIKTRGLRNQDTAVLIDGIRLRDPAAITGDASPFLGDVTLTSVSRVEVLRGSGSSLYGTNAIGGVVNLETPVPSSGPNGQASFAAGGLGLQRFRGNFTDALSSGRFGYSIAAARTAYTEGIDGNDNAHNTNLQSRLELRPGSKTNISGRFFISDAYVRLNASPDTIGPLPPTNAGVVPARPGVNFRADADDADSLQRSRFFSGTGVLTHELGKRTFLRAFYSGLVTGRRNENGPLGPGFQSASTSVFDGQVHTANASVDWAPNDTHTLKFGYEFEYERFGNEGFTPSGSGNFLTRASQGSSTLFAQDVIGLFDGRLQLAGGVRAQFFRLGAPRFSLANAPYSNIEIDDPPAAYTFDGAAAYYFRSTGTKLRAHVGNGYRVPSLYERFGTFFSSFGTPSFVALGDPGLRPERSVAADAGIEQELLGEKVRLSAVYFYTRLTDTIGYGNVVSPIGPTQRPFGGYVNQKGGLARGGEFSGTVKPTGSTDIFASYTYTNSDQRTPQVAGSGVISTLGIPAHQFTLVATQRFKRFWVNFDLEAGSSYLAPIFSNSSFRTYVFRFGGNRRGDVTSGYTFMLRGERFALRLWGTIENVFGHEYYENGFRTAGRNGRAGLSFAF